MSVWGHPGPPSRAACCGHAPTVCALMLCSMYTRGDDFSCPITFGGGSWAICQVAAVAVRHQCDSWSCPESGIALTRSPRWLKWGIVRSLSLRRPNQVTKLVEVGTFSRNV